MGGASVLGTKEEPKVTQHRLRPLCPQSPTDVHVREFQNNRLLEQPPPPHSSNDKTQAQKGEGTCPMSLSQQTAELDLKPRTAVHILLS